MGGRVGKGWFIRKNHVVGIFVLFLYLLGIRPWGPSDMIVGAARGTSDVASCLPASVTKETSDAGLPPRRGPGLHGARFLSHKP